MTDTPPTQPPTGRSPSEGRRHYWDRFAAKKSDDQTTESSPGEKLPPGEDLAALRRGANREPGGVPEMWRFHREFDEEGARIPPRLRAEHHALTLFGFHQQSIRQPVNVAGSSVGAAMRRLRASDRYSEDAIDRRFAAAATSDTVDSLAVHLRGLVSQLKRERIGFDYDRLFKDLIAWQYPESRARIRRVWASDYFRSITPSDDSASETTSA